MSAALAPPAVAPVALAVEGGAVRLGGRTIWSGLEMAVPRGEFVALLGPNGAGKSTLLKVVLGLQGLAEGRAEILGGPPGSGKERVGYLPQRRNFDSSTRLRGIDLVQLGLDGARWGFPLPVPARWSSPARRARRARVAQAIEQVGATRYAGRPIGSLSGGEQQRLLIAQALVRDPELLILDEPLDSLDLASQAAIAGLLQRICREAGVAVLLVAHDVNPLLGALDQVVYLAGGRAVQGTVADVITGPTLSELYGAPVEVLRASDGRLVVVGQPEGTHHHHPHGP